MLRPSEYTTRSGAAPTMIGTVVIWYADRGFGFLTIAGQRKNVFLHFADLEGAARTPPRIGDVISFDMIDTPRGPRAVDATVVKSADQSARA